MRVTQSRTSTGTCFPALAADLAAGRLDRGSIAAVCPSSREG
jgi:hypothetical protein